MGETVPQAQERIVREVSTWSGVAASSHRFGGTEFRLGKREIGHVHGDYQADIVFPKPVRNRLVAEKKAEPHHILPESGWITFRFREEADVARVIETFKLSYDIAKEKAIPPDVFKMREENFLSDTNLVCHCYETY